MSVTSETADLRALMDEATALRFDEQQSYTDYRSAMNSVMLMMLFGVIATLATAQRGVADSPLFIPAAFIFMGIIQIGFARIFYGRYIRLYRKVNAILDRINGQ